MKAEEWEPYYSEILDFFGFSREDDEHAAHVLAELLPRDDIILQFCVRQFLVRTVSFAETHRLLLMRFVRLTFPVRSLLLPMLRRVFFSMPVIVRM